LSRERARTIKPSDARGSTSSHAVVSRQHARGHPIRHWFQPDERRMNAKSPELNDDFLKHR
jgi:hypothetical protein